MNESQIIPINIGRKQLINENSIKDLNSIIAIENSEETIKKISIKDTIQTEYNSTNFNCNQSEQEEILEQEEIITYTNERLILNRQNNNKNNMSQLKQQERNLSPIKPSFVK